MEVKLPCFEKVSVSADGEDVVHFRLYILLNMFVESYYIYYYSTRYFAWM
jgi:hypothetical protein